jgi:SulP family sulfate permease
MQRALHENAMYSSTRKLESRTSQDGKSHMEKNSGFAELYTPKLLTVLREGYGLRHLQADALAGLTVAIVALPLSMAIAIGSGAKPEHGLYAAVIGGFIISALGGSRFQIGGPAGAFIALVAAIIAQHGYDGFLLATLMGGVILLAIGYLGLGSYIRYIPHPVLVGFTAGIAIIIFSGEIRDLFGLRLDHEPSAFIPRLAALWEARGTLDPSSAILAASSLALMLLLRRLAPRFPAMLAAVIGGGLVVFVFDLPIATIGSQFGGIPNALPAPSIPHIDMARVIELLPAALAIALLGGIESLLSAVVADGMTGRRHRSNCELVAQGYANIACALFGGLCATGTIARTATNIRAQAHSPVAGLLHSLFLLMFMLVAAPLASYVPLATLAAILALVAWNMIEREEFIHILRHDRGEASVLLGTFLLTIFYDLVYGIAFGVTLGAILFMHRMAGLVEVTTQKSVLVEDQSDSAKGGPSHNRPKGEEFLVCKIAGPFFFGTATTIASIFDDIGVHPRGYILDLSAVPLADSTAARTIDGLLRKAARKGVPLVIAGAQPQVQRVLERNGITHENAIYAANMDEARRAFSGAENARRKEQ